MPYKFYLTPSEYNLAKKCAYIIPSCRAKNGKANVTYFLRYAVRETMRKLKDDYGGIDNLLEHIDREYQLIYQAKELRRLHILRYGKRQRRKW